MVNKFNINFFLQYDPSYIYQNLVIINEAHEVLFSRTNKDILIPKELLNKEIYWHINGDSRQIFCLYDNKE